VREAQAQRLVLEVVHQEDVHVDRAGAVAWTDRLAPQRTLHLLAHVEQLLRAQLGPHLHTGIEEVRLVEDLPDRIGVISGGGRHRAHPSRCQFANRGLQSRPPVPDVGPQAEISGRQ
jgi:hypothetical protein